MPFCLPGVIFMCCLRKDYGMVRNSRHFSTGGKTIEPQILRPQKHSDCPELKSKRDSSSDSIGSQNDVELDGAKGTGGGAAGRRGRCSEPDHRGVPGRTREKRQRAERALLQIALRVERVERTGARGDSSTPVRKFSARPAFSFSFEKLIEHFAPRRIESAEQRLVEAFDRLAIALEQAAQGFFVSLEASAPERAEADFCSIVRGDAGGLGRHLLLRGRISRAGAQQAVRRA